MTRRNVSRLARAACLAFVLAGCGTANPAPLSTTRVEPPSGTAHITRLRNVAEVPLRGYRVEGKAGDFMLENANMVAVVSTEDGNVIDFGPTGSVDALVSISPGVFDGLSAPRAPVVFVGPAEGAPGVLHIVRRGAALPVKLHTFVTFRGSLLVIDSTVEPENPDDSGMAVGIGERVAWGNQPTWVEGVGLVRRDGGVFSSRFIGREGASLSYALALDGGPNVVRFSSAYLAGFFAAGRGSELTIAEGNGRAPRRTLFLSASASSVGDAAAGLVPPTSLRTFAGPASLPPDAHVEVVACPDQAALAEAKERGRADDPERKPFARFSAGDPLRVPDGCFDVRVRAPGRKTTDYVPIERASELALAPSGQLVVAIVENGKAAPGRVQVRGVSGTSNPDWGDDPDDGAAVNAANARLGLVNKPVPAGKYRVIVDRGFEYSAFESTVDVVAGQTTYVSAPIERVVDTTGWLSADLHLHAEPSPDAPQSLDERVVSLVVAGVEVGVATDHNRVTDYSPVIKRLGLTDRVASVVGDEVTTDEMAFGHFNVFPLEAGSEPLAFRRTSPAAIFHEARTRAPYFIDGVLQVNHPRMGDIGYFDILRLDRERIPGLLSGSPWARLDFDAIEVFNGDDAVSIGAVQSVMKDWTALLDVGIRTTATGNSDSHRASFHEPGLPRTYVRVPSDSVAAFDQRAFIDSIRKGRAVVSGGPFLTLDIGDAGVGDAARAGVQEARVRVGAPPWMDIAYVEIVQKGKVVARFEAPFEPSAFAAEVTAKLDLRPGDWVIAVAGGTKEMDPLFRRGVVPFAFTNPIVVVP